MNDILIEKENWKELGYESKEAYCLAEQKAKRDLYIEKRIMDIFLSIGISAHLQGYYYLKESVKLAINEPSCISCITKKMYPKIADIFHTTACRVERGIRHALEVAYAKGRMVYLNEIFGLPIFSETEKPTNSEFVAIVADRLSLETR